MSVVRLIRNITALEPLAIAMMFGNQRTSLSPGEMNTFIIPSGLKARIIEELEIIGVNPVGLGIFDIDSLVKNSQAELIASLRERSLLWNKKYGP